MKYYLDCEFDGHNGPLLSLALVADAPDGDNMHVRTTARAKDPWVQENVEPLMDCHTASWSGEVPPDHVGAALREFLRDDKAPVIVADSPVDIGRFCVAISTGLDGGWASFDGDLRFEVHDVACYPTSLTGAVQHNAWWDAMALRYKLRRATQN